MLMNHEEKLTSDKAVLDDTGFPARKATATHAASMHATHAAARLATSIREELLVLKLPTMLKHEHEHRKHLGANGKHRR
jgi:hypothetical protein